MAIYILYTAGSYISIESRQFCFGQVSLKFSSIYRIKQRRHDGEYTHIYQQYNQKNVRLPTRGELANGVQYIVDFSLNIFFNESFLIRFRVYSQSALV